jgi:amino acid transporter
VSVEGRDKGLTKTLGRLSLVGLSHRLHHRCRHLHAGEVRRPGRIDDGDLRAAVRPGAHPVLDFTDRLLPAFFSTVHSRFRTPFASQVLIGIVVALIAATFPIGLLGEMVSIGTLFAFLLVCLAVLHLRRSSPGTKRPFRTPAVPLVPLLGVALSLLLMLGLPLATWLRLVVWLAIGPVICFGYGHRHSVVPETPVA